jgi:phosphoglycolate phosphatase-like HAD superfamily hydrolase
MAIPGIAMIRRMSWSRWRVSGMGRRQVAPGSILGSREAAAHRLVYEAGVGKPTVLLFDVDGTLIYAGGAGRRAITRVFAERYGQPRLFDEVRFHGMTDRAIVRGALGRAGVHCDEATIDNLCAAYLVALADEMPRSARFKIHPGVPELLARLGEHDGVAIGLGTGNLREGARIKLEHARLMHHFTFGGYGCDDEDRASLIRRGAERGASQMGVPLGDCRIVVIGDTPRDIEAARAVGADAVVVETGGFGAAELRALGAHHAFATLAEDGVLSAILG